MINYEEFIPGVWQDEINANDFVDLNISLYKGKCDFLVKNKIVFPNENYDFLTDESKVSTFFVGYKNDQFNKIKEEIDDRNFDSYVHTTEIKKMVSMSLISKPTENKSFIQPDFRIVVLYGTRTLINDKKHYLKSLEKQLQTTEWFERRINLHKSIEALEKFEIFCEEYGVSVKKPVPNVKKAFQYIYLAILYAKTENTNISFSLTNIFTLLDILIEYEIKHKTLTEEEAQLLVDELFLKISFIQKLGDIKESDYDLCETINSKIITKTTCRLLSSMIKYREYQDIGLNLLIEEEKFDLDIQNLIMELFSKEIPLTIAKRHSKDKEQNLFYTPFNSLSQPYEEMYFQKGTCDLLLLFKLSLNGGKEPISNTNLQTITKPHKQDKISFDEAFSKFEAFVQYFITIYTEYINASCYYEDVYHTMHFRNALISNYPYYMMNINFYNIDDLVSLLSSIYQEKYEIIRDNKDWIIEFKYDKTLFEEFIFVKIINVIKSELDKMLFYKNGIHNLCFYDVKETKMTYQNLNKEFGVYALSQSYYIGNIMLNKEEFSFLLNNFTHNLYTHLKIHKK